MKSFYRLGFKTVFFFTGISDRKKHRKNQERKNVLVVHEKLQDDVGMNLLTSHFTSDKKEPLLVDIHGGGWMYGDEHLNLDFGKWYAERGFKVALLNYKTVFDNNIKAILHQLYDGLLFLRDNAEKYNLDLSKAVLVGDSAGAGLALELLSVLQSEKLRKVYDLGPLPFPFRGLALYHAACYPKRMVFVRFPKFMDRGARKTFLSMYCGKEDDVTLLSLADFSDYADEVSLLPPTYILTSLGDSFVKYQTDLLVEDLDKRHLEYTYNCLPDKTFGHVASVLNVDGPKYEKANEAVLFFLKQTIS